MNIRNIINFVLLFTVIWWLIFWYKFDIETINKNWYIDLSNRLIWNNNLANIEDYINKNNITYIKVNWINIDLNRVLTLKLNNKKNITFEIINSKKLASLDEKDIYNLVYSYKNIILTPNNNLIKNIDFSKKDISINIDNNITNKDFFELLFIFKNKNINKLQIEWIKTFLNYQTCIKTLLIMDNIKEFYIYDDLSVEEYLSLHNFAMINNKKIFFSKKQEIQKLAKLPNKPKDLILDYITNWLEIKDILDINTIFWNHEFDLISFKQKFVKSNYNYSSYKEDYDLNLELLNKYINYKKADLRWNNIVFNKDFDICNENKILYVSKTMELQDICWLHTFEKFWLKSSNGFNEKQLIFIKINFDFFIEKNINDFNELINIQNDNSFEEFWLQFNDEKNLVNWKKINKYDLDEFVIVNSTEWLNFKKIINKCYIWYIDNLIYLYKSNKNYESNKNNNYLFNTFIKYKNYIYYNKLLNKDFNITLDNNNYFFKYLLWEKSYKDINFFKVIDNTKNGWVLIFYTAKYDK